MESRCVCRSLANHTLSSIGHAGASVLLWRSLLPLAELWEAEVNGPCVDKHRASLQAMVIHPLVSS